MNKHFVIIIWLIVFIPYHLHGEPMKVDVIPIQNFDKRADGMLKIDLKDLPLPSDFLNRHQVMIYIPPMGFGGNHKHPRREVFISLSDDVELHWVDENGIIHINKMKEENQVYLFDVHPFVPHAIINLSQKSAAVLLELTDDYQHDVEPYEVLLEDKEF